MSSPAAHLVLAGGVTGGHVYPGLAVVESLREQIPNLRATLLGTGRDWERAAAAGFGVEYFAIPSGPLVKSPRRLLACLKQNCTGYLKAARFLRSQQVTAVLGLGGYASVPTATAAVRLSLPLVLLEANVVPGKATRWLARGASHVCLAFDAAAAALPRQTSILVTGTPVRAGFTETKVPRPLGYLNRRRTPVGGSTNGATTRQADFATAGRGVHMASPRRLVVLGGSQGAARLNEAVPEALALLAPQLRGWEVTHVAGPDAAAGTAARYAAAGLQAQVLPYVADMPRLLSGADAAISRAGGATIAELAAAGVPAVLCPYPFAADQHQRHNALAMQKTGGCLLVDECQAGPHLARYLADSLGCLLRDETRLPMARAMRTSGRGDAAYRVARALEALMAARRQAASGCGFFIGP